MRIPPSVIVMSLVTAVPFALAVRDTMKPHDKTVDEMTSDEREAHFEEEMQKEAADEAAREAAENKKRDAVYDTMFGSKPAQLGAFFGAIHLGMPANDPGLDAFEAADHGLAPPVNFVRLGTLDEIQINAYEQCDQLRASMVRAWQDSPDGVYLDPASHQRAGFHDCAVTFDRYVEVNQWIDKKGDVPVALSVIGTPLTKLREQLGEKIYSDDGEVVMWKAPGVGRGTGATSITARIENDKVAGITADVVTDAPTIDAVRARVVGLLGKGTPDPDDEDTLVWKGKTPATLRAMDGTISLDIGK
jgi:hypothetical protein